MSNRSEKKRPAKGAARVLEPIEGKAPRRHGHGNGPRVSSPASASRPALPELKYIEPDGTAPKSLRGEGEPELLESLRAAEANVKEKILPAWYASYRFAGKRSSKRPSAQAETEAVEAAPLERIQNTRDAPWRYICNLEIRSVDQQLWGGSGWLIGPRTVITAGHNVYMQNVHGWAYSIRVSVARNGVDEPHVQETRDNMHSVEAWIEDAQPESDYGAIVLPEAVPTGSFGCETLSDTDLQHLLISTAGYPIFASQSDYGTLWGQHQYARLLGEQRIGYAIDTEIGMSGGPVFFTKDGKRFAVGIHNYEDEEEHLAKATRITNEVFDNIMHWRQLGE